MQNEFHWRSVEATFVRQAMLEKIRVEGHGHITSGRSQPPQQDEECHCFHPSLSIQHIEKTRCYFTVQSTIYHLL